MDTLNTSDSKELSDKKAALILVGTPIGNLSDFSPRGIEALSECDFIAAEDTRVTLKLLNRFGVKKPMVSYYEHNMRERGAQILGRIAAGETCCLVTDAGMPSISDPGELLVAQCHEAGIPVRAVPGPTALATALALSGLPAGRFCFEGFLSTAKRSRRRHLDEIKNETRTLVFYEAPHKLPYTLRDLYDALGDRRVAILREMTKLHEEIIRTTLSQAAGLYDETAPRGEFVLVIEGAGPPERRQYTIEEAAEIAQSLMDEGLTKSEAAKQSAKQTGIKKSDIYQHLASSI